MHVNMPYAIVVECW